MTKNQSEAPRRNPGPDWGCRFILAVEAVTPSWLFRRALHLGAGVGACFMPRERAASREYLRLALGREPGAGDIWRHFSAFMDSLMGVLLAGRGRLRPVRFSAGGEAAFAEVASQGRPVLYGTFHLGHGDLIGYLLGRYGRPVRMIRLRIENAEETRRMGERYGEQVRFLWVDRPENLSFALKDALESGHSLAMKCDRVEQAGRVESFELLGHSRRFPFTIYHLALLFDCPVIFAFAEDDGEGGSVAHSSAPFYPDPEASRMDNLRRARAHFRGVLNLVERLLRKDPYIWFNFVPWNDSEAAALRPKGEPS